MPGKGGYMSKKLRPIPKFKSEEGDLDNLKNVMPHLSVGGALVFDDIAHPAHPYLLNVWKKTMAMFPFLSSFEFTELGYGVAFAIRKG
jgi:hypothetical protein